MVLWDASTGEMLSSETASEGFPVFVPSVAVFPNGKYALTGVKVPMAQSDYGTFLPARN